MTPPSVSSVATPDLPVAEVPVSRPDPAVLGPDSLAWKHAGDNLQLLMAGTTLLLQVAHPVVGAGVEQHSVFKTDPWGRMQRTAEWGMRLLYGGPEGSPQAGRELRDLHRDIKGTDDKGRRYFALDREAYAWVHMTTYYTMVTTQRLFGEQPFTPAEESQLYREWVQQGRVLGIRDEDMPADLPAFQRYFDNMVEQRLEETSLARYLIDVTLKKSRKPPALKWLPDRIWNFAYRSAGSWLMLNTAATLPPALRQTLGVEWNRPREIIFNQLARMIRLSLPLLSLKARYAPPAAKALAAAQGRSKQALSKKT